MFMKGLILYVIMCFFSFAKAQNIDSLWKIYNNKKEADTTRLKSIHEIGIYYYRFNSDTALIVFNQELKTAQETRQKKYEAKALNGLGVICRVQGNIPKAIEYYAKSLKIRQEIGNKKEIAASLTNLGNIYSHNGDILKALDYHTKSLKISEEIGDKEGIASSLACVGNIYFDQGDLDKALEYQTRGLKISEEIGDKEDVAAFMGRIGVLYQNQNNTQKALEYYTKGLKIHEEIGDKMGASHSHLNLGSHYFDQNNMQKALEHNIQSLKLCEEIGDRQTMMPSLINIGAIYKELGNYSKALEYYNKSMAIAMEIGHPADIRNSAFFLFEIYKKQGNTKLALENHELYIRMRDSLKNEENTKATIKQQMQYDFDKKQIADSLKVEEERKVSFLKFEQEKKQRYFLYGGLALVIVFAGFILNRFLITQRQSKIIAQQKHLIEERHQEITDSIIYAERIQKSFLATTAHLNQNLFEYFVLFKPKDVVSGDFYWSATLNNGNFILATSDSTGHGVPGAIMSLLNITSLEKAIETLNKPSDILNTTRKIIIDRLKKDGSEEGGKDGMDCSLCVYDFKSMKLFISAANNPVWIVKGEEIIEIKADKMPVGKHDKQDIPFTQHEIDLQKGDVIYTLTDGFPDQFGGERGKKFMSKNLRELLVSNSHLSMNEQKELLYKTFRNWTGDLEQVDDVTVIGIRV